MVHTIELLNSRDHIDFILGLLLLVLFLLLSLIIVFVFIVVIIIIIALVMDIILEVIFIFSSSNGFSHRIDCLVTIKWYYYYY